MKAPALFDATDPGPGSTPLIQPWRRVELDPEYGGAWLVTGDVDGDGRAEIVSARNVNVGDVHYTSAVVAQDLEGKVLWRWGDPSVGRRGFHHDVACQIHDWDNDGRNEVILCADGFLVELDGVTGIERQRLPLPPEATDCLVFADLSGRGHAGEVLVKTRYSQVWAMNRSGRILWTIERPGGYLTAHQPVPVDVDGDGRDEIVVGYALAGSDGELRWVLENGGRFPGHGHLDCCRVLRRGPTPEECVLALTCCGDARLMAVDGKGRVRWEIDGPHFESIDVGHIHPGQAEPQLAVDLVPHTGGQPENEVWTLSADGELLGRLRAEYCRFHTLVDWDGDGYDELVLPHARGLFDGRGQRIGTFAMEAQPDLYGGQPHEEGEVGNTVIRGDVTGDGVPDVILTAPGVAYVFANPVSVGARPGAGLGCGTNFTFY